MSTRLVTFATELYYPVYEEHAGAAAKALGISPHSHYTFPMLIPWVNATNLKPAVILDALKSGDDVLYIDADSEITSPTAMDIGKLVPDNCVGAFVMLDHGAWYGDGSTIQEPLAGTIFLRQAAIPLVEQWAELASDSTDPDGVTFAKIFGDRTDMLRLPLEWCYTTSMPDGSKPLVECDSPIIKHFQVSRTLKTE
jgi:hypothetical protein